jgi:RNA polymerase sigma-70 factor (ECF subfamily)
MSAPPPPRSRPTTGDRSGEDPRYLGKEEFSSAYAEYRRLVFSVALAELSHWADAEDLSQQVFGRAWRSRHTFDSGRGELRAWLLAITRNLVADRVAARARDKAVCDAVAGTEWPPTVSETADAVIDRAALANEVNRLPRELRTVVRLAFWDDLSHQEIAERTGWPLGTVKSHVRRAVERLRAGLSESGAA